MPRRASSKSSKPVRTSWSLPRPWARSERAGRWRVRWKVLGVYAMILAVLGWLGATTSLYLFIKHQSMFTEVRYSHIVGLPFTLKAYRQSKGDFWLKQGMASANEGRWRDSFDLLRQGLPFAPENEEARMMLARIYLMAGRPDMAQPVLLEGLQYRTDKTEYLRTVIGFLFGQQADTQVVELTRSLLEEQGLDDQTRRMVAVSRVYALFNRDRFAEIPSALQELGLDRSVEGRFIEARMSWETGQREGAVVILKDLHERASADPEIYRTLIYYLRELGRTAEARRVAMSRKWSVTDNPDAFIDYISLSKAMGETAQWQEAVEEFFVDFRGNSSALLALGVWASREGESDLAWQIVDAVPAKSVDHGGALLLAIESELASGDYRGAAAGVAKAKTSGVAWIPSQQVALLGMQAAAELGLGLTSEAQSNFNLVMASPVMVPANLVSLASHVNRLGNAEIASNLLRRALELDTLSQPALVALLRIKLDADALDASLDWVRRLPQMRKPPAELMQEIVRKLESDRYLFLAERTATIDELQTRLDAVAPRSRS